MLPNMTANNERLCAEIVLPYFVATEVVSENEHGAIAITIPNSALTLEGTYHVNPRESQARAIEETESHVGLSIVSICSRSSWMEWACLGPRPTSISCHDWKTPLCGDVHLFDHCRRFGGLPPLSRRNATRLVAFPFPEAQPADLPVQRALKSLVGAGDVAAATAKRRMGSVIGFYNWLKRENVLIPEHAPWKETDPYIDIKDRYGFSRLKKVVTTDV